MASRTVDGVTQTLSWDPLSNLTGVDGETFLYDGGGQRFARITGTGATVWIGDVEATDTDTTTTGGVQARRYVSFDSSTVGYIDADGVKFLLGDVQGSAQVAIGPDGTITRNAYTPYGLTRGGDNLATGRGWLGQVEDAGTGLTYLNARFYDPVIGRFLSPDPLMNPTDPRTLDPYRYANNNPTTYTDATGLEPYPWHDGTVAGVPGGHRDATSPIAAPEVSVGASSTPGIVVAVQGGGASELCSTGFACGSAQDEFYGTTWGAALGGLENWTRGFADSAIGVLDLAVTAACSGIQGGVFTSAGRGCWSTNDDGGFTLGRFGPSGFSDADASYRIGNIVNPLWILGGHAMAGTRGATGAAKTGPSLIGKSHGLGTVVENPGLAIKGFQGSRTPGHALNQIINRGISPSVLRDTVASPPAVLRQGSGTTSISVTKMPSQCAQTAKSSPPTAGPISGSTYSTSSRAWGERRG